jgi:hypothetical protein
VRSVDKRESVTRANVQNMHTTYRMKLVVVAVGGVVWLFGIV